MLVYVVGCIELKNKAFCQWKKYDLCLNTAKLSKEQTFKTIINLINIENDLILLINFNNLTDFWSQRFYFSVQ